ncbi:uncharacterized protein B0P05DRAFT_564498 [Gilbertella persicaria]|uniref:uncharacterized protein n=1 Tax=Gilbertella persicaria TaxID=101096 RepID=UPI00221F1599|nr:uncharacterized protein B0P05DRAFT_564498 [Gilbertella persicaria]KAI8048332.1 hypothetical protein B0P05DRAFT_564498 [Gilbertella persicaria]
MTSYWYSTNGMKQCRLSNRYLSVLDQAYERRSRIQIADEELFGKTMSAIANPYQGTMTAEEFHFGLYRQPPIWRMSSISLDTLTFMDCASSKAMNDNSHLEEESNSSNDKLLQRKKLALNNVEEKYICCTIS